MLIEAIVKLGIATDRKFRMAVEIGMPGGISKLPLIGKKFDPIGGVTGVIADD